jgi:hypothetical protein
MTNLNIPLMLKFTEPGFQTSLGFTADAGVLFNVMMKNKYNYRGHISTTRLSVSPRYVAADRASIRTVYDNAELSPNNS